MGMDISNITKVFQWGLPRSLASLIQRFGRAARDGTLTACCTLVISQDYYKITAEDNFKCTNNVQRNLKTKHPAIYDILRSSCLRRGFLEYLGVASGHKCPPAGMCCSRYSQRDNHPVAVIGSRGLCNEAKEAARKAVLPAKLPHTHAWIEESVLKQLMLWRDEVTEASLRGKPAHDLWRPAGCIPDAILSELAKGARAIINEKWPINRVSSWYGWRDVFFAIQFLVHHASSPIRTRLSNFSGMAHRAKISQLTLDICHCSRPACENGGFGNETGD